MKKHIFTIITLLSIFLLSLGAGIFLCTKNDAVANASTGSNILSTDAPQNLQELQTASDEQLSAWTQLSRFDGRDYGYITPARNQGGKLICWAYTAIGAVEASILRKGIDPSVTKETLNLDEIAAAYVRHNRDGNYDPLFNTKDDIYSDDWNQGAHADDAFLAMTQGYSPIDQRTSDMSTDDEIKKAISESEYFVRGYTHIDNDIDAIKRAILQYGSVTMEYKAPNYTWQNYLYHSDGRSLGHASLIVGWDDSIKSNLFLPDQPDSDGAWIVKNSWGPGGNSVNGTYCFYLSYESYLSSNLYAVDTSMKKDYPNLYYYDGQIVNNDTAFITDAHGAIYEAKLSNNTEQEQLTAIVFGFKNKKLTANIKVYRHLTANPGNVNDKINNPSKGELVAEKQNIYFENEGLYTVDLDEPIPLEQGEYFSIVVSGVDADNNPLYALYGADSQSVNDMTYRLYNGEWTSIKDSGYYADSTSYNMCARIRAITNTVPRETSLDNDMRYARVEIANRLLYYVKGQEQIPEITVYFGDKILQKGQDYTVNLFNNITPGTATVEIVGKNLYFGTRATTFEVAKPKYPPGAISGIVEVYNNTTMLHQIPIPTDWEWIDSDFRLQTGLSDFSYSLRYVGEDAACYQIKTCGFKVNKIAKDPPYATDISDAIVEIDGMYTYTGTPIIPFVTVTHNALKLHADTDYTLVCHNNINAGIASVTVTGKGLYTGEITKTFQILKADFPKQVPPSEIFVGRQALTLNDVTLDCKDWYWKDSDKPLGDRTIATAEYNGLDKDNYNNTQILITIIKQAVKPLSQISELQLDQTLFVYDGKLKTPKVLARDNSTPLVENTDFRVDYQNNKDAGQASATIIGINNYSGTKTLYFTIEKADRKSFAVSQQSWTFGDEIIPQPTLTGEEESAIVLYSYAADENKTFTAIRPSNAGKYIIKANIAESKNYKSAESTANFIISHKNLGDCTITVADDALVYTGEALCPEVYILNGHTSLVENVDFSATFSNNINAGTTASVTLNGINNYVGTVVKSFEIQKTTIININTTIHLSHKFEKLSEVRLPVDFEWDEDSLVTVSKYVMKATAIYNGGNYDIEYLVFDIIIDEHLEQEPTKPETPDQSGTPPQNPETDNLIWLAVAIPSAAVIASCVGLTVALLKRNKGRSKK